MPIHSSLYHYISLFLYHVLELRASLSTRQIIFLFATHIALFFFDDDTHAVQNIIYKLL